MAYNPTEWTSGDVITAEKLNKVEGAIDALGKDVPPFIFHVTKTVTYDEEEHETVTYDSDKTFEEVYTAVEESDYKGAVLMILKTVEQYYGDEPYTEVAYLNSTYPEDDSSIIFYEESIYSEESFANIGIQRIQSFIRTWRYTSDGAVVSVGEILTTASSVANFTVSVQSNTYTFNVTAKYVEGLWSAGSNIRIGFSPVVGVPPHDGTVVGISYKFAGSQNTDYVIQVLDPVLGLVNFTAATETDNPTYTKAN